MDSVIKRNMQSPLVASRVRGVEKLRRRAADLFNQQCWCWGRDVLRPQGNWLVEQGFDQLKPPPEREDCSSSVYRLSISEGQSVVLRGFGAFFGDRNLGGVFLFRNKFAPRFMAEPELINPPWSESDLPSSAPITDDNRGRYLELTLRLIDWIISYETDVISRLGLQYREMTLFSWNNSKRSSIPARQFVSSWQELSHNISDSEDVFI